MTTKTIQLKKLITYLNIVKELQKLDKGGIYKDVSIDFPEDFIISEKWEKKPDQWGSAGFYKIEFPIIDIDEQTKRARDRLRYAKRKDNIRDTIGVRDNKRVHKPHDRGVQKSDTHV